MARKTKPCEYCEEESWLHDERKNCFIYVESYPDNGTIALTVIGRNDDGEMTSEDSYDIPFDYCPACGRKLGF